MTTELAPVRQPAADAIRELEQVVLQGNLKTLPEAERIVYYARVCESLGLNPLTRPFEYIELQGKLTLYARKDATDQLRDLHGVSVTDVTRERDSDAGLAIVTAHATDRHGRSDTAIGVVSIANLKGENLANALMKAETKAKRRVTLSICGLGWMDEVEAMDAKRVEVQPREALAGTIAARTAAIESGGPATVGVLPARDEGAKGEGGRSVAATPPSPSDVKPRSRKKAPLQEGDPGYGSARAHAVATERGLDHAAVHRIAWDVLRIEDTQMSEDAFSVSAIGEPAWEPIIAAILAAPIDADEVSVWAGTQAVTALDLDASDPWPQIDDAARDMFGQDAGALTPAQWREFGIRIEAQNPLP